MPYDFQCGCNLKNDDMVWLHISSSDVDQVISDSAKHHKDLTGSNLSVSWNLNQTEAIVKICGVSNDWLNKKSWASRIIKIYTRLNQKDIFNFINGPDWRILEAEDG